MDVTQRGARLRDCSATPPPRRLALTLCLPSGAPARRSVAPENARCVTAPARSCSSIRASERKWAPGRASRGSYFLAPPRRRYAIHSRREPGRGRLIGPVETLGRWRNEPRPASGGIDFG